MIRSSNCSMLLFYFSTFHYITGMMDKGGQSSLACMTCWGEVGVECCLPWQFPSSPHENTSVFCFFFFFFLSSPFPFYTSWAMIPTAQGALLHHLLFQFLRSLFSVSPLYQILPTSAGLRHGLDSKGLANGIHRFISCSSGLGRRGREGHDRC